MTWLVVQCCPATRNEKYVVDEQYVCRPTCMHVVYSGKKVHSTCTCTEKDQSEENYVWMNEQKQKQIYCFVEQLVMMFHFSKFVASFQLPSPILIHRTRRSSLIWFSISPPLRLMMLLPITCLSLVLAVWPSVIRSVSSLTVVPCVTCSGRL